MLRWTWDDNKNRVNKRKHGLSFETAQLVFRDPLMAHRPDVSSDEERWHTIGMVGTAIVMVSHTWPQPRPANWVDVGRIITYEEGSFH